ncbi:MAG: murein biosynthesis integral membrane protein MurJ [Pseudomonadota bacterium]
MSKKLFKSTSLVSSMTMISRVLGFVRDMVAAQIFGATAAVDAFYIAFKIPNFMRALFAEGSFSQAFVPVLSEYREHESISDTKRFISYIGGNLGSVLLIITLLGLFIAPLLIMISAPGLEQFRFDLATHMLRITFPYLILISLTAFVGATLNSFGRFGVPAFTPALLNIVLIATALFLSPYLNISVYSQAWGVLIAGFVQLAFQLIALWRRDLLVAPRINWRDPGVRKVLLLMLPALFGASIGQLSLLLNTIFASFLPPGSVTWLYYSDRLAYFPLGVFGVALATVVLPHLSRQYAKKSQKQYVAALDWAIRINLLIGIPAALILWVLAGPIITTLFNYGIFNQFDVLMTRQSVIAYSIGLTAFMLVKVLVTGFFARQNVKTPVRIGVVVIIANVCFNALLIVPLRHAGLALATSLSAWLNVLLLLVTLIRKQIFHFVSGWPVFLSRLIAANFIMVLVIYLLRSPLAVWFNRSWEMRFTHLFLLLFIGIITYFAVLFISGIRFKHLLVHETI